MIPESFGTRNVCEQQPQRLPLMMKREWKSVVVHGVDDDPNCPHSYHQDAVKRNEFHFGICNLIFTVESIVNYDQE